MPPAPPVTSAMRPASALGLRHAAELRFFKQPVLDVEGFLFRQAPVLRDARGFAHDIDGIHIELGRDPRGRLIGGKRDHPDARNEIHDCIGIAHRGRVRPFAALVVGGVVLAIGLDGIRQAREDGLLIFPGRVVTRSPAAGSWCAGNDPGRKCRGSPGARKRVAADKLQHGRAVVKVSDLRPIRRNESADPRHDGGGDLQAPCGRTWRVLQSAEARTSEVAWSQISDRAIDHIERGLITRLRCFAPGNEAVRFQASRPSAFGCSRTKSRSFSPSSNPGRSQGSQPISLAIDLARQPFAIRRGGDRDDGVGMHMIDVRAINQSVKRRIDTRGARVQIEGAVWIEPDHAVFILRTLIKRREREQLVHVERGKAIEPHGPDIPARTLHPQAPGPAVRRAGVCIRTWPRYSRRQSW